MTLMSGKELAKSEKSSQGFFQDVVSRQGSSQCGVLFPANGPKVPVQGAFEYFNLGLN